MQQQSVLVGISGGVDSAVSAWLLQQQGYRVKGVFMRNWDDDGGAYCTAQQDFLDACKAAEHLGIELTTANFTTQYKEQVFAACLAMFKRGLTPNPDVWCNSYIKFGAFLDYAVDKADFIATGHYARLHRDANGIMHLLRAVDNAKDQSYFLHQLSQRQLARSLFPLGTWRKADVRHQAQALGLANHNRPDSTGICFIGERPFTSFLREYLPEQPGEMVDSQGKILGQHNGLAFYTLGQRKGLGIGGSKDGSDKPWYVAGKDIEHNRLVVVQGDDHPFLYHSEALVEQMHWIGGNTAVQTFVEKKLFATIRYRQLPQACSISLEQVGNADALRVRFREPQKAVTPGQFAVFYLGEECLGGGILGLAPGFYGLQPMHPTLSNGF